MPAIAIATIVAAGATSAAAIYSANKQSGATQHAADLTSHAAADTLAFQKDQAAKDQANFQATQKANYDQWAARQGNLSNLGQLMGLPSRSIPAFVPTTAGTPPAPAPVHPAQTSPALTPSSSASPPMAPGVAGASQASQPSSIGGLTGTAPQIGQTKTFPNGATGLWDGRGWVAQ